MKQSDWIKPLPLGDRPTAQELEDHADRNQPWAKAATLTPEEVATLRTEAKETSAFARKAFAHLRPTTTKKV